MEVYVRVFSGFATEGALAPAGSAAWPAAAVAAVSRQPWWHLHGHKQCPHQTLRPCHAPLSPPSPPLLTAGTILDETRGLHRILEDEDEDFSSRVVWAAGACWGMGGGRHACPNWLQAVPGVAVVTLGWPPSMFMQSTTRPRSC